MSPSVTYDLGISSQNANVRKDSSLWFTDLLQSFTLVCQYNTSKDRVPVTLVMPEWCSMSLVYLCHSIFSLFISTNHLSQIYLYGIEHFSQSLQSLVQPIAELQDYQPINAQFFFFSFFSKCPVKQREIEGWILYFTTPLFGDLVTENWIK